MFFSASSVYKNENKINRTTVKFEMNFIKRFIAQNVSDHKFKAILCQRNDSVHKVFHKSPDAFIEKLQCHECIFEFQLNTTYSNEMHHSFRSIVEVLL